MGFVSAVDWPWRFHVTALSELPPFPRFLRCLYWPRHTGNQPRLIATSVHAAAREIMFSARRYGADEARAMGLVNRVLPDAELDEYVRQLALELAKNAPLTIAASKSVINTLIAAKGDHAEARKMVARCMKSEDYVEGRRAFMEKRSPAFKGK